MSIKFSRITVTFSALWWINCVQLFDSCSELPIIKTKALATYSRYTFVYVGQQPWAVKILMLFVHQNSLLSQSNEKRIIKLLEDKLSEI